MNRKIIAIIVGLLITGNFHGGNLVTATERYNKELSNISLSQNVVETLVKNVNDGLVKRQDNIIVENLTEETRLKKGKDATIKIKVTNTYDKVQNASLIVGLFNQKGKLIKYVMVEEKLGKGSKELDAKIKLPGKEYKDSYRLKAFVWDKLKDMRPLSNVVDMEVIGDNEKEDVKNNEIISAETQDSTNIVLTFKDNLKYQYGNVKAFKINGVNTNPTIKEVKINNDKVILNLNKPMKKAEKITISYNPIGSGDLTYSNGKKIQMIKNTPIENTLQNITIMAYVDADNNVESQMLSDVGEMKRGLTDDPNLNVITLIDRQYGNFKHGVGEEFTDTRLYKLEANNAVRIDGGSEFPEITKNSNYEANMGDAHTLKKFIRFCKNNYKADKYVLLILNHGAGVKGFCVDETDNYSIINIGEISDVLTKEESVDLLAFEACLMGNAEVAYQFRPGNGSFEAKGMIASSPTMIAYGLKYDSIFRRLKYGGGDTGGDDYTLGGKELIYDPSTVTMGQLAGVILEEQYNSLDKFKDQVLAYYDLNNISKVKQSVDELSKCLWKDDKKNIINEIRGSVKKQPLIMYYFCYMDSGEWSEYPYFDLYDFANIIYNNYNKEFNEETREAAKSLMDNIDKFIVYSYAGEKYREWNFKEGKTGVSIFLPEGDLHWKYQNWYTGEKLNDKECYGNLYWCRDSQEKEMGKIGNWFDLLNNWYSK